MNEDYNNEYSNHNVDNNTSVNGEYNNINYDSNAYENYNYNNYDANSNLNSGYNNSYNNYNETNNINNNYGNSYNNVYNDDYNNNSPPVNNDYIPPKSGMRKVMRIISIVMLSLVVIYIILMILSYLKLIRLPWIDYPEVLNLSQSEVALKQKGTYQLSSDVYPSQVPYGRVLYSSSDPTVVEVNELTGYITAKRNGVATVTAKLEEYGDILDTCDVVVSDNNVFIEKIIVNNQNINLVVGKEHTMSYSYEPNNASVHSFVFSSSNESVARVSETGVITAAGEGSASIIITDKASGVSASQIVNVYNSQKIEDVDVSQSKASLVVGGTVQLSATVEPETAIQDITWSSVDSKIATVTSTGLVTGVNYGSTKIIATAIDGTNAVVDVNVQEGKIKVDSVSFSQKEITINVGTTKTLKANIKPSSATNQAVTWTSNFPNVVSVSANGTIKGVSPGVATISVKTADGGHTAHLMVTVKKVEVIKENDIKLIVPSGTLYVGKSITVKGEVLPSNATYKDLTWTSSDNNVATVSKGTIYGKGEGVAIIKVTSHNGISKSLTVKVDTIKVRGISLSDSNRKINIGEEYTLIANISPADATDKRVSWTSSNSSVITVGSNGLITPHQVGTATVTATTNNGIKASCSFTVTNEAIMPQSVSISKSQVEVKENGTIGLTAVVQPSNSTNQKVTWSIENGNLATINANGILTGISDGVTRVTAKTVNGKIASAFVVIKTNNKTKYNYLEGTTIKYWIENNTSKNAYITHIWVQDAYSQFATMVPDKYPGLAQSKTLMNKVANKYPNKAIVGSNASGFVSYNAKTNSGFDIEFAKNNPKWNYSAVIPLVISDGVVKRDFTNTKMPNSGHPTYGIRKDGTLSCYYFSNGSDINANVATANKIKADGVKNTFGFYTLLVANNTVQNGLIKTNNTRNGLCQIDKNNFVIYTNANDNRSKGFSLHSLAQLMVSDKCLTGVNLDGGGSTNLLYKKKDSKSFTGVRTTSRAIPDVLYFYGD